MSANEEFELTETEKLKIENLSLKQELCEMQMQQLQIEMGRVYTEIKERLGIEGECKFGVNKDMTRVQVVRTQDNES